MHFALALLAQSSGDIAEIRKILAEEYGIEPKSLEKDNMEKIVREFERKIEKAVVPEQTEVLKVRRKANKPYVPRTIGKPHSAPYGLRRKK